MRNIAVSVQMVQVLWQEMKKIPRCMVDLSEFKVIHCMVNLQTWVADEGEIKRWPSEETSKGSALCCKSLRSCGEVVYGSCKHSEDDN